MKRLILLRHGKAEMGASRLDDFDRQLAQRGRDTASLVGDWLAENSVFPDLALVSAARRAQQTWDIVAPVAGTRADVRCDRKLYLATPGEIVAFLEESTREGIGTEANSVLVVGHNPGFETLAGMLAGPGSDPAAAANLARGYPTAGLAVFEIDTATWSALADSAIRLAAFVVPREL